MAGSRVTDKDRGWKTILKNARKASDANYAAVGVIGTGAAENHDGITNAELASVHEYGTLDGRIPERSFIRATIDEQRDAYRKLAKTLSEKIIDGKLVKTQALDLLGVRAVADIVRKIRSGLEPDITDVTKDRKGSSKPLIDTGQLVQSITHAVRR